MTDGTTSEPGRSDGQGVQVILHLEREEYSIGESVSPRLQVLNGKVSPVKISGFAFDWDELAFSEPNAARLIAPDGQDLMLPYKQPVDSGAGIVVQAGGEEWQILPISSHLHLRRTGDYSFQLELADDQGDVWQSNDVRFNLKDVEYSDSPDLVELTVDPQNPSFAATDPIHIHARFTNKAEETLTFLKPQDDSLDGWANPIYQFTVTDDVGRELPLARRSGTMATPKYSDDTQFTLRPGGSHAETLRLPVFPKMRKAGEYKVRLTYIVRENAVGKGGVVLDRSMNWPRGVFVGRLASNETTVKIG